MGVLVQPLKAEDSRHERSATAPLGRPLPGIKVYICDMYGNPLPEGMAGELLIGGMAVARGYVGRPELTAAVFVPDHLSSEPGARLYRTGDRARFLEDGAIEYLGRFDDQVKVRGFRIEPGEIEAVLGYHPAVVEKVVAPQQDDSGKMRLVAYVSLQPDAQVDVTALREHVRRYLPEVMVPAGFVILPALPRTAHGKVDRAALPAIALKDSERREDYVAPRTPTEASLAAIWAGFLGDKWVGIHDNFFDLGGHSLMAMSIVSRLRQRMFLDIPLRSLFEHPTIASLAGAIDEKRFANVSGQSGLAPVALSRARYQRDTDYVFPTSFAQRRIWFEDQIDPGNDTYRLGKTARFVGVFDAKALERSLVEMIRRHETLRTTFEIQGGEPVQVVRAPYSLSLQVIDLGPSQAPPQPSGRESLLAQVVDDLRESALDLRRGPLLRAWVVRCSEREHVLILFMHHITIDHWSQAHFWRELATLYKVFAAGKPSPLPEPVLQYADFAVWQRDWLQGAVMERQLAYWLRKLAGRLPVLDLTTRSRPSWLAREGARRRMKAPAETVKAMQRLGAEEGATPFMTMLAALQTLLHRYSGLDDIIVGTLVANRHYPGVEDVIGFFANVLALRTDFGGEPSFREVLQRVQQTCLEAYAHQDLPFEVLVEKLQPARELDRKPVFQVLFLVTTDEEGDLGKELGGLEVERLHSSRGKSGEGPDPGVARAKR